MNLLTKIAGELYKKKARQEDRLHDVYHGEKIYRSQKAFDQAYYDRRKNVVDTHRAIIAKTGLPADFDEDASEKKLHHAEKVLASNKKHAITAPALAAGIGGLYGAAVASRIPKHTRKTYLKGGLIGAAVSGLGMKALMMHGAKEARKDSDTASVQLKKYRSA